MTSVWKRRAAFVIAGLLVTSACGVEEVTVSTGTPTGAETLATTLDALQPERELVGRLVERGAPSDRFVNAERLISGSGDDRVRAAEARYFAVEGAVGACMSSNGHVYDAEVLDPFVYVDLMSDDFLPWDKVYPESPSWTDGYDVDVYLDDWTDTNALLRTGLAPAVRESYDLALFGEVWDAETAPIGFVGTGSCRESGSLVGRDLFAEQESLAHTLAPRIEEIEQQLGKDEAIQRGFGDYLSCMSDQGLAIETSRGEIVDMVDAAVSDSGLDAATELENQVRVADQECWGSFLDEHGAAISAYHQRLVEAHPDEFDALAAFWAGI